MRKIKFRAWWIEARLMVNIESWRPTSIEFFVPVSSGDKKWNEHQVLDEPNQYILMQFTGLNDKNGKEIYEGDIFSVPMGGEMGYEGNKLGYIDFVPEQAQYMIFWNTGLLDDVIAIGIDVIEVIGNIYEHPELIK